MPTPGKKGHEVFNFMSSRAGPHLPSVSKAGAHDDSLVVVLLVVIVDPPHTQHTGVLLGLIGLGMLCLEIKVNR